MVNQPELDALLRERARLQAALAGLQNLRRPPPPAAPRLNLPPPENPMAPPLRFADINWDAADAAPPPTASARPAPELAAPEAATPPAAPDPVKLSFEEIDWGDAEAAAAPPPTAAAPPLPPPTPEPAAPPPSPRALPENTDDVFDRFDWE